MKKAISAVGKTDYYDIYRKACDSLEVWQLNNLPDYSNFSKKVYRLDSLICFNNSKSKLITALYRYRKETSPSDELIYFYGEKIKGNWFFFRSSSITLPRTLYQKSDTQPLTYSQFHQIALNELFNGYVLRNGEINEAWFTSHFEHVGWGDINHQEYDDWCFKSKRYTDIHEYYQACHLCKVKANWASRDTTQAVKQLPGKNVQ